jgi:hypothetical protein
MVMVVPAKAAGSLVVVIVALVLAGLANGHSAFQ